MVGEHAAGSTSATRLRCRHAPCIAPHRMRPIQRAMLPGVPGSPPPCGGGAGALQLCQLRRQATPAPPPRLTRPPRTTRAYRGSLPPIISLYNSAIRLYQHIYWSDDQFVVKF